jgi:alkylation response protein AidB-like acyl-CoA dehydrogenase
MERFTRARELAARLGDPFDPAAPLSHRLSARWDEEERYPHEAVELLRGLRFERDFVPAARGGELRAYDELVYLARVLASRDLTVAVTQSALVWSTLVWIAGDERLQRQHAASLLAGRVPCLAYSEEPHGADLLATETAARPVAGGYVITGRKWPINRAATGQSVVLLARTGAARDPRGLSLFWFEKSAIEPSRLRALPRVPTLGVRGCDISGLELDEAFVPAASRIGPEGAGLEIALKGFHVTRTLCAGLSLGAVGSALRTTVRLARSRRLYGDALLALPQVRRTLADAYALLLAIDAAALAAARMLHASPAQSATTSAVAKYAIPRVAEEIIARLAAIHGARFYMRDHHDWGLMQRVFRDNLLIAIFDGSAPVNLHALSTQLFLLARFAPGDPGGAAARAALERAALACRVDAPPPPFDGAGLELMSRGGDDILNSLGPLLEEIERAMAPGAAGGLLLAQLRALSGAGVRLYAEVAAYETSRRASARSSADAPALSDLAARYATLHTAAAAVHVWWRHQGAKSRRPEPWLVLALAQLLPHAPPAGAAELERLREGLLAELLPRSEEPEGYYYALAQGRGDG